jgi:NitT/TauT family transport system ATP-binding protein
MSIVQIEHMSFAWQNSAHSTEALSNVTFNVGENQIVSVVGPSGAGKSSLLHVVAGLQVPKSGTCLFRGNVVTGPSPDRGLIFQSANLFPWLTVLDNVAFGLKMREVSTKERHSEALSILNSVGLGGWAHRRPYELSGGMAQRVSIARALCTRPSLLLMDEPFASVDIQTRHILGRFVLQVWEKYHTTIILVTHSLEEAIQLSDKIVMLSTSPGRVIEEVVIDLPRPRNPTAARLLDLRMHLGSILEEQVNIQFESESFLA